MGTGREEVWASGDKLHGIIISALVRGKWLASRLRQFTSR
jgi:hypothetical protein